MQLENFDFFILRALVPVDFGKCCFGLLVNLALVLGKGFWRHGLQLPREVKGLLYLFKPTQFLHIPRLIESSANKVPPLIFVRFRHSIRARTTAIITPPRHGDILKRREESPDLVRYKS
jgi:hypothetical protein